MVELFKGKEVIDVKQDIEIDKQEVEEEVEEKNVPLAFFTVTVAGKQRPQHLLVKAETALDALVHVQTKLKYFVVAVHVTEYSQYIDTTQEVEQEEKEQKE